MASSIAATATDSSLPAQSMPAQGGFDSAGAGITGGYTGDSLSLQIIIALLLGLALYNAVELIVLILVTFNKYRGLYFWSLVIAGFGVIPYSLGFLIKFFQLLDPSQNEGYVAVVFLTIGWYMMLTGQSVVLWSRLHLLTKSPRVLRFTLYMIIVDAVVLHIPTTVLTFGSNSNSLSDKTLMRFVNGYNVMEKVQMVGFFMQELILSVIYIKETVRMLKLSESVQDDLTSVVEKGDLKHGRMRKVMYQLIAINAIIIMMDIALLSIEFANLYLIETTLKGVVYSIKLKLEFAVLGKLVQLVRTQSNSDNSARNDSIERVDTSTGLELADTSTGLELAKADSVATARTNGSAGNRVVAWPSFVDPRRVSRDITHAPLQSMSCKKDKGWEVEGEKRKKRRVPHRDSWIDEEMDRHNIE